MTSIPTKTPLRRKKPLARGCKLRRVSRKRARMGRNRTRCNQLVALRSQGWCELRIGGVCQGKGVMVHEILTRARGGSITDPENCLHACAACHRWAHDHDEQATKLGFLKSRKAN